MPNVIRNYKPFLSKEIYVPRGSWTVKQNILNDKARFQISYQQLFCYKMQGVLVRYARGPRFESRSGLKLHPSPST